MKKTNKILSILLAFVMFFALTVPAVKAAAPTEPTEAKTKQVILHKLLMTEDELANWAAIPETQYDGTQTLDDLLKIPGKEGLKEIANVYFAFQNEASEWVDANGAVVTTVEEALGGLTTATGLTVDTSALPAGNYQIVEVTEKSTYVGPNGETLTGSKAVPVMITLPMYNSDGLVTDAHVYPKNASEKPQVDKDFEGSANAANPTEKATKNYTVGESVPYEIQTIIPKDAKYATAKWSDQMTEGLTFNNNVVITLNDTPLVAEDYTLTPVENGFDLALTTSGLAKVNAKTEAQTIIIKYSATLNSAAVVDVPETNDVTFNYGNNPDKGNTPIPTKPVNGEITVTKTWAEGSELPVEGIDVIFTLYNAQTGVKVGESVTKHATTLNQISHTFTGLDPNIEYKVVETYISGYSAEYSAEAGKIGVTNHKDNNPAPVNPEEPKVVTYGKKFVKTGEADARLAGAQFVVQNNINNDDNFGKFLARKTTTQIAAEQQRLTDAKTALDKAVADYNANKDDTKTATLLATVETAQKAYDAAFAAAKTVYVWVDGTDAATAINNGALVYTSNAQGQFEVTGLKEGLYKLVEVKAPEGYAKLQAPVAFTVAKDSYTTGDIAYTVEGTAIDAQQVINKKVTIPQTGGMGTLIFTVAGIALMGVAIAVLVKNNKKEEIL